MLDSYINQTNNIGIKPLTCESEKPTDFILLLWRGKGDMCIFFSGSISE